LKQQLLDAMKTGREYGRAEIEKLFPGSPKSLIHDALKALVKEGKVWNPSQDSRYTKIEVFESNVAIQQCPSHNWGNLEGYEASLRAANIAEPVSRRS